MLGASADSCMMREIGGVRTVELVYVGGLLRMGGGSLLVLVWRSVGEGESDVWLVREDI